MTNPACSAAALAIRTCDPGDFENLVARWHETNVAAYAYVAVNQRHTLEDARRFFAARVVPECEVWIAQRGKATLGMIALDEHWIRQLAVWPEHRRRGVGRALVNHARCRSPTELRLFTFARNAAARAFYEGERFVPVRFGVSPAPELEPDIEYRWSAA